MKVVYVWRDRVAVNLYFMMAGSQHLAYVPSQELCMAALIPWIVRTISCILGWLNALNSKDSVLVTLILE